MEKIDFDSNQTSDDEINFELKPEISKNNITSSMVLRNLIPESVLRHCNHYLSNEAFLFNAITNLHHCNRIEDLYGFFKEIEADLSIWLSLSSPADKTQYVMQCLEKNVKESLKKVNNETETFLKNIGNKQCSNVRSFKTETSNPNNFDWLTLKTSNEMLKSKLKTKLVQTINEFKNEKKLRQVMGKKLSQSEKIHLEDDSFEITDEDKQKVAYEWTDNDEQLFLHNIEKLKQKFTKTQFLKNCHRYKFITNSELATLAAEEISRKLDRSNKAFLSRDFLLDKYFSTKENLTEKEMKFILKTSPLLSKCVDKAFVRAAIKNIKYQDIDKMELQIAQQIIAKFETIRNLVRKSRKTYKQHKNNETKEKIKRFEQKQHNDFERAAEKENLHRHKTKMMRNLNYRSTSSAANREPKNDKSEKTKNNWKRQKQDSKKIVWPVPLNTAHPPTGIFIRDGSQQCNQEFNEYEKNYYEKLFCSNTEKSESSKMKGKNRGNMVKFYTGGPLDNGCNMRKNNFQQVQNNSEKSLSEILKIICNTFKTTHYYKKITQKIDTIDLEEISEPRKMLKTCKSICQNAGESGRTKKAPTEANMEVVATSNNIQNLPTEEAIKSKILQGKQKAKMAVYIKKLLSLAAENSFISLRALNVKFSPIQINTTDRKGNTALFYATKHQNKDFIDYLLAQKADVNHKCEKGLTPLHNVFRSGDYQLICKCLISHCPPNLNILDDYGKTALAYCPRKILQTLGLENGVVCVSLKSLSKAPIFDNNSLLSFDKIQKGEQNLEMKMEMRRHTSRLSNKYAVVEEMS